MSGNGSGFTHLNPVDPAGDQVAFLQQQSSISQVISFAAGSYAISFPAAQRYGDAGVQTIQLTVDGQAVGAPVQPASTNYENMTINFWVSAGNHTIGLVGLNSQGGDNTAFIASVSITSTSGLLQFDSGSSALSENTGANAVGLRGDDIDIDTSSDPAIIGANPIAGGAPRATLTGPGNPTSMAFDAHGNLYVVWSKTVEEFAQGSTVPSLDSHRAECPPGRGLRCRWQRLCVRQWRPRGLCVYAPAIPAAHFDTHLHSHWAECPGGTDLRLERRPLRS